MFGKGNRKTINVICSMEELRNLQQMASLASGRFNQYDGEDFILPEIFKEQVK